jgi:hypothetical protein
MSCRHLSCCVVNKKNVFAKVRPDLNFDHPTVDDEPSADVESGRPMIVLNACELRFLVGECFMLIGGSTRMVVHSKRAK